MRAPWLPLTLTAGIAFSAAWGVVSLLGVPERDRTKTAGRIPVPLQENAAAKSQDSTPAAGEIHDALVRQAVESADLIAGVTEILAHRNEDHCADTRLVCMVENLPAARLPELSALLDHFISDDYVVKFVLGTWAQRDAAGALAWVQAHASLNDAGIHAFLHGWTRAAPDAALAWLDAQPFSTKCGARRTAVIEAIAERNPAGALITMQTRGWTAQYPAAVLKLLQNWGGHNPVAALAGLRSLTAEMGLKFEDESNGGSAIRSESQMSFHVMLQALLNGAFDRNPADAAALISQLTPEELAAGMDAVASEVLARDPSGCDALFVPNPDPAARRMLASLARNGPAELISSLSRIQVKALKEELLIAAASSAFFTGGSARVSGEAQATIDTLLAGMTDEERRVEVTATLAERTAVAEPEWAAKLWARLPVDGQLLHAHSYFKNAGESDAPSALEAFRASPSEVQTQSLKSLCAGMARTDPEAALQLVLQRSEPELRAECAAALFTFWAGPKPEAALVALEQHAGEFDLAGIMQQLPSAGHFRHAGGVTDQRVSTVRVAEKIKQLTRTPPSPAP